MNGFGENLAPWDELQYFATPLEQTITVDPTGKFKSMFSANPNRIAILFGNISGLQAFASTTGPAGAAGAGGIPVLSTTNPFWIIHEELPGLPQVEWFNYGAMGASITVMQIVLMKWPRQSNGLPLRQLISKVPVRGLR